MHKAAKKNWTHLKNNGNEKFSEIVFDLENKLSKITMAKSPINLLIVCKITLANFMNLC